jgi:hypothetical protein
MGKFVINNFSSGFVTEVYPSVVADACQKAVQRGRAIIEADTVRIQNAARK